MSRRRRRVRDHFPRRPAPLNRPPESPPVLHATTPRARRVRRPVAALHLRSHRAAHARSHAHRAGLLNVVRMADSVVDHGLDRAVEYLGQAHRGLVRSVGPAMQIKHPEPVSKNWAFFEWADIPSKTNPDQVYLRRLRVVQTPWFSTLIHWIYEPDPDRDPHDHPWPFWSLIVRGGYVERVYGRYAPNSRTPLLSVAKRLENYNTRVWRRRSWHKMSIEDAHHITEVIPGTITCVFTGRRVRQFCFWTPEGEIPWGRYLGVNYASEDVAPEA